MNNILETSCLTGFIRMCHDGWLQGWHERNGGNLTYRMTAEDVAACRPYFDETPREWVKMDVQADNLAGEYFITTGSGKFFRNVELDPAANIGIVEINEAGNSWRIVWGLENGAKPTSEFPSHFMNHSVRKAATQGANRVIYHCHATNLIALTYVLPLTDRDFSRALWQSATECPVVFPEGVGVCPWMVPGGADIAMATSEKMKTYQAAVWAQHGLFASGPDFDITFGLAHTIEKAAEIYVKVLSADGWLGLADEDIAFTALDDGEYRVIARGASGCPGVGEDTDEGLGVIGEIHAADGAAKVWGTPVEADIDSFSTVVLADSDDTVLSCGKSVNWTEPSTSSSSATTST